MTATQARRAVEIAQANFDNFNLDLMYALPSQTLAEAEADLATALSFAPPHLSLYHLTMEPNTDVRQVPAGAAGRRRQRRHAGHDRRSAPPPPASSITKCRPMRSRVARRATT